MRRPGNDDEATYWYLEDDVESAGPLHYCGRHLGVELIPGSDGQCGPTNGPQCQSCRRFQIELDSHTLKGDDDDDDARESIDEDEDEDEDEDSDSDEESSDEERGYSVAEQEDDEDEAEKGEGDEQKGQEGGEDQKVKKQKTNKRNKAADAAIIRQVFRFQHKKMLSTESEDPDKGHGDTLLSSAVVTDFDVALGPNHVCAVFSNSGIKNPHSFDPPKEIVMGGKTKNVETIDGVSTFDAVQNEESMKLKCYELGKVSSDNSDDDHVKSRVEALNASLAKKEKKPSNSSATADSAIILETMHPAIPEYHEYWLVSFPDAKELEVRFDLKSYMEKGIDVVKLFKNIPEGAGSGSNGDEPSVVPLLNTDVLDKIYNDKIDPKEHTRSYSTSEGDSEPGTKFARSCLDSVQGWTAKDSSENLAQNLTTIKMQSDVTLRKEELVKAKKSNEKNSNSNAEKLRLIQKELELLEDSGAQRCEDRKVTVRHDGSLPDDDSLPVKCQNCRDEKMCELCEMYCKRCRKAKNLTFPSLVIDMGSSCFIDGLAIKGVQPVVELEIDTIVQMTISNSEYLEDEESPSSFENNKGEDENIGEDWGKDVEYIIKDVSLKKDFFKGYRADRRSDKDDKGVWMPKSGILKRKHERVTKFKVQVSDKKKSKNEWEKDWEEHTSFVRPDEASIDDKDEPDIFVSKVASDPEKNGDDVESFNFSGGKVKARYIRITCMQWQHACSMRCAVSASSLDHYYEGVLQGEEKVQMRQLWGDKELTGGASRGDWPSPSRPLVIEDNKFVVLVKTDALERGEEQTLADWGFKMLVTKRERSTIKEKKGEMRKKKMTITDRSLYDRDALPGSICIFDMGNPSLPFSINSEEGDSWYKEDDDGKKFKRIGFCGDLADSDPEKRFCENKHLLVKKKGGLENRQCDECGRLFQSNGTGYICRKATCLEEGGVDICPACYNTTLFPNLSLCPVYTPSPPKASSKNTDLTEERSGIITRNVSIKAEEKINIVLDSNKMTADRKERSRVYFEVKFEKTVGTAPRAHAPRIGWTQWSKGGNEKLETLDAEVGTTEYSWTVDGTKAYHDKKDVELKDWKVENKSRSFWSGEEYEWIGVRIDMGDADSSLVQMEWTFDGNKWFKVPDDFGPSQKARGESSTNLSKDSLSLRACFYADVGTRVSFNFGSYKFQHASPSKGNGESVVFAAMPPEETSVESDTKKLDEYAPLARKACWRDLSFMKIGGSGSDTGGQNTLSDQTAALMSFGGGDDKKKGAAGLERAAASFDDHIEVPDGLTLLQSIPVNILDLRGVAILDGYFCVLLQQKLQIYSIDRGLDQTLTFVDSGNESEPFTLISGDGSYLVIASDKRAWIIRHEEGKWTVIDKLDDVTSKRNETASELLSYERNILDLKVEHEKVGGDYHSTYSSRPKVVLFAPLTLKLLFVLFSFFF